VTSRNLNLRISKSHARKQVDRSPVPQKQMVKCKCAGPLSTGGDSRHCFSDSEAQGTPFRSEALNDTLCGRYFGWLGVSSGGGSFVSDSFLGVLKLREDSRTIPAVPTSSYPYATLLIEPTLYQKSPLPLSAHYCVALKFVICAAIYSSFP